MITNEVSDTGVRTSLKILLRVFNRATTGYQHQLKNLDSYRKIGFGIFARMDKNGKRSGLKFMLGSEKSSR